MSRRRSRNLCVLVAVCALFPAAGNISAAGQAKDPVAQAIADGDVYQSRRKYELALEAYRKADKLSHHNSPEALLKIAVIEKKAGLLSDAASDAKKAIASAHDNKPIEVRARLLRANLLTNMAGKPTDNKLKEAETELRATLALDPAQAIAHLNLGMVLLKQERDPDGLAELKTFVELPGADPSMAAEARRIIANPIRARAPFVPDFAFTTHEKQEVSNASLRGRVVLLDFWGTWCPPCRESVPLLKNIQKKYNGKAFQLISISSDDEEDVWKTFIEAQHMDWSEYLDSSRAVQESFKIDSFPTYIVVDKDGVIRFRQSGLSSETQAELEEAISKALKKESNPALAKAAAAESASAPESAPAATPKNEVSPVSAAAPESRITPAPDSLYAPPEAAQMSGNLYVNQALGMRYEFPQGWIAEKLETLHKANDEAIGKLKADMLKQHPEMAGSSSIRSTRAIFYASRRGDGDALHAVLSSIRIQAIEAPGGAWNEAMFRKMTDRMVAAAQLNEVSPPTSFEVHGHKFTRAEFERKNGALHYYQSFAQTEAGDYLLTIECFASSIEELRQIGDSLQKMEIKDE